MTGTSFQGWSYSPLRKMTLRRTWPITQQSLAARVGKIHFLQHIVCNHKGVTRVHSIYSTSFFHNQPLEILHWSGSSSTKEGFASHTSWTTSSRFFSHAEWQKSPVNDIRLDQMIYILATTANYLKAAASVFQFQVPIQNVTKAELSKKGLCQEIISKYHVFHFSFQADI